jgi:hypothetical protein
VTQNVETPKTVCFSLSITSLGTRTRSSPVTTWPSWFDPLLPLLPLLPLGGGGDEGASGLETSVLCMVWMRRQHNKAWLHTVPSK